MSHALFPSWRLALAIAGFFGSFFLYSLRVNMSLAVMCMIRDHVTNDTVNSTTQLLDPECKSNENISRSNNTLSKLGEFDWNKTLRGVILGSFFLGYMITQIPGGWLAGRYGGRKVILISMTVLTLGSLLTPIAARTHPYLLIAVRIIQGLSSGLFYPAFHAMWASWASPTERSRLIGIVMIGLTSFICFILWALFVFDFPSTHPWISQAEVEYLESNSPNMKERPRTPWLKILTSTRVWAIYISQWGNGFIGYTVITSLPSYIKEVLNYNIKANGLFNALPFLCQSFGTLFAAYVSDKMLDKKLTTHGTTRKIMEFVCLVPTAVLVIVISYLTCTSRILAVTLLCLAVGFTGFGRSGYMANMVDIAPMYAGEIMGIGNTLATLCGIITPIIVSELTPNSTATEWRKVFFLCAGFCLFGITTFIIFSRGQVQPWAEEQCDNDNINLIGMNKETEPKTQAQADYGSTK